MTTTADQRTTAGTAIARALVAVLVMGTGLAIPGFVASQLGASAAAAEPLRNRLLTAGAVCLFVVVLILLLRWRWDRAPVRGIGLTGLRSDTRGFLLGIAVVAGAGVLVLAGLSLVGAVRWTSIDPSRLVLFLATNAVIALLLEAIPEEVSIRGYALTALRARFARSRATPLAIGAFLLVPVVALSTESLLALATGSPEARFTFAPGGEDAVAYYLMLAVFGLMLIYAREATVSATVWTCIGAHLAWLTLNRLVLGDRDTGVEISIGEVPTLVFFGVYFSLSVIGFNLLRSRAERRGGGMHAGDPPDPPAVSR